MYNIHTITVKIVIDIIFIGGNFTSEVIITN